ncbi:MAG: Sphingosine kinase and enzyme related to eukaryotic diacylglycerol kinase [Chthonomonadaceae bacterium]|nr:Sphingosine kinase and enzyme related to eukaryotic diacylglycerol kinase [Chthonomonadaceae bacterium]
MMKVTEALQQPADSIRRDPVCLILANPRAGRLAVREYLVGMSERFTTVRTYPTPAERVPTSLALLSALAGEVGLRADVELSPTPEGMAERIRAAEAQGYDTIVAVGGDGTVHHVAQHLVGASLRLGILPLGTANNFARGLNIPGDLEGAFRTLARGQERIIDVGRIKNEYFIEAVGVGLFADSLLAMGGEEVHRHEIKRIFEVTVPILWNPRTRRLYLTLDGQTEEEEVLLITVSNSRYLGENWPMAPDASLEDGLFDIVTVGAMSRWELMRFAVALMRGTHLNLPNVKVRRASRVEIRRVHRVNHPLPVHADDHILAYLPVSMEVVPRALRVLAPLPTESEEL